ncbi:MAG: hypothetical protein IPK87_00805 [Planctomycetes bacterium]|nr:hypothetical protein [Planctomycetota bacterium]
MKNYKTELAALDPEITFLESKLEVLKARRKLLIAQWRHEGRQRELEGPVDFGCAQPPAASESMPHSTKMAEV